MSESHVEQRGHVSFHDDHQVLRVLWRHECEKGVDGLDERANDRSRAVHRQQALGEGKAVRKAIQAAHELGELRRLERHQRLADERVRLQVRVLRQANDLSQEWMGARMKIVGARRQSHSRPSEMKGAE